MSANMICKFLGHEVSLPVETAAYAGVVRNYEENKSKVYEVLTRHMQELSFAFNKDIKSSFDYFIEGEVQSLIRLGVYNVTASDYIAENEAYNRIDDIALAGGTAVSKINLRELDRLMHGVNAAKSEAMTEIKPSRTALITNSFTSSVLYAATETLSENHQMQKAQQKYSTAIQRLTSDHSADREIAKRLREVDYPAAKECIDDFFDTLRSQTLGYMENNELFDYSSVQSFDKNHSCELLTYYPSTQSTELIVQAFKECPYNPALLLLIAQEHLLDKESFETLKPMLDPDSVTEMLYSVMIKENATLAENENWDYWRNVINDENIQAILVLDKQKKKEAEEQQKKEHERKLALVRIPERKELNKSGIGAGVFLLICSILICFMKLDALDVLWWIPFGLIIGAIYFFNQTYQEAQEIDNSEYDLYILLGDHAYREKKVEEFEKYQK